MLNSKPKATKIGIGFSKVFIVIKAICFEEHEALQHSGQENPDF